MTPRILLLALLALPLLAPPGAAQQRKVKQDRRHITAEELAEQVGQNGYEVVEKLRPDWLRRAERRISLDQGRAADRGGCTPTSARSSSA